MRYLLLGILYLVVYLGAGALLGGHPLARMLVANMLLLGLAASICVVVLRRRRHWEGTQRLFWDGFAAGMTMWCVGQVGFTMGALTDHRSWVQWHTMFSLCGGIGPVVAMLARPYLGSRKSSAWAVGIDIVSYAMFIGFVFAYFIMVPSVVPATGPSPQATLLALVQLQRFVLATGLVLCVWLARKSSWRATFVRLAMGAAIGFFLRLVTSGAISKGRYQEGGFYDLAWIVPFGCYLWAALEAPRSSGDAGAAQVRGGWRSVLVSATPVFLIPLIGYSALYLQPLGDAPDSFRALLTGLITVAGLGLLTLRLAAQGGELERAGARMRLLAAATEQTGDLILITRANGVFEHANDAFVRALGYSRHELANLTVRDLMAQGFGAVPAQITQTTRERGIWRGTVIRRRRDGSTFPAACTVVGLRDPAGSITHYVGVERDTTDELKLRDQLVHSERLSAIGELVAGVAHEINNPLQTIVGSVELMMEERTTPAMQRDLELVRREAARAGQIVRNLLSFVRRSTPDRAAVDLNDIIRATVELRQFHLQQHNIGVAMELYPGAIYALVNREEIQQIILNLVLNAEQAMAMSGKGTRITLRSYPAGAYQAVEVADDGPGVGADLTGRIFEPFFTTKDVGQGTGLGLSISHGIAAAHGGALELRQSTRGACFRLTLPAQAVQSRSKPATAVHASEAPGPHTDLHALIVDDEVPIRGMLARLLARRGFQVHEASSGEEALAVVDRASLSVVLCDVRMPGMNGLDLFRQLTARDPHLARSFVFITGDKSSVTIEESLRDVPLLEKPFTAADLSVVLERLGIPTAMA